MSIDFYGLLGVDRSASTNEIKQAYHRALLIFHPDKYRPATQPSSLPSIDIDTLRLAYATLSSATSRAEYDRRAVQEKSGPRPAHVLSLEEFTEDQEALLWTHSCRCGGVYRIAEVQMERGQHLIGCGDCSEVVWVGYELAKE